MAEWKQLISEWLSEYAALQENEIKSFAAEHEHNHEIATAIFNLFYSEDEANTSSKIEKGSQFEQLLENVCTQLFSFYRSKEVELQRFTLQFVPTLIYNYLSSVAQGNKKTCRCIETLLIGLYNFEVVDEEGKPKVVSFRLPSLAQSSIYHEPLSLGSQFLTESALRRWEECNTKLVSWGPLPQVEAINAQNRLKVMSALLFIYNRQLSLLPKLALRHFCIAASRIVTQGFKKKNVASSGKVSRVPVSPNFLLEMIEGAYFAMFNEFYTLAHQAVQDIDQRAQYELFPDVMLVTSAVINSLKNNPSGQPCDGPMGISVALSPATTTVTMSKSMITNASFRTKKLPDDIPIQAGQAVPSDSADMLTSITEEAEAEAAPIQRGGAVRSSKPKLSSFPVLGKKTKDGKDKGPMGEKKVTLKESSKGIWNSLSGGGGDMVDAQQKSNVTDISLEANGSMKDEKISMASIHNSTENSDTRSQITSDSLDMETTPRFAAMQVSSV